MESSPYARIFKLPIGYFGVVYYLYMFGLAALLALVPFSRAPRLAALLYVVINVCFSSYFKYMQVSFIHAFCIYCFVSAVTTLLLFIAAVSHFRIIGNVEAADLGTPADITMVYRTFILADKKLTF